jgi:hypothetical protein
MRDTIDMAREDITRMAREAGFVGFDGENGSLRRFAALVRADEREACAKLADQLIWADNKGVASAIRARGKS